MVESIDRHRGVAGAGARLLCAGKDLLGEVAELAGVVEGEAAQELPDHGGRRDPAAQHAGGGAAAKPRPRGGWSPRWPACRGPGSAAWRRGWRRLALPGGGRRRRPRRCRAARRGWQPAATRRWPRCGGRRSRHRGGQGWVAWDGGIERVSFLAATADLRHPYSRSSQGPFQVQVTPPRQPHRWIQAETTSRCPPWCSLVHASLLADRVAASAGVWPRKYAATA